MTTLEAPTAVVCLVLANTYRDSVELMRVAAELEARAGIVRAALVMATDANRDVLEAADLLHGEAAEAGPNDLVVAVAGDAAAVEAAHAHARALLAGRPSGGNPEDVQREPPRTLAEALDELASGGAVDEPSAARPGDGQALAPLALISTPGTYATAEALKALKRGLDVFLFSDNVSVDDEIELKSLARRKRRLLMGPDCGTAILNGVPLGFANAVAAGSIGLAGASGTGLQQVTCLIDRLGEGISQAIGVGGRDLDERVGGTMMLAALERLSRDAQTRVIVLISKPPAAAVAGRVLEAAREARKPVVVNFLGAHAIRQPDDNLTHVSTLEAAAHAAVGLLRSAEPHQPPPLSDDLVRAASREARRLSPSQRRIVGLFSGGTLCKEAAYLLHDRLPDGEISLLDLGDDEFTVGRPHPMIDARLRSERILAVADDPTVGVLLLDVVLGYGSHANPAGALIAAIVGARECAQASGRYLAVVASVCGTRADPQGLTAQEAQLAGAGVLLAPSNAQAAHLAALIAGASA